jgi:hypothetical protein
MTPIQIPWGFIVLFFALLAFYFFNRKMQARKLERKNRLKDKRQELSDSFDTEKDKPS